VAYKLRLGGLTAELTFRITLAATGVAGMIAGNPFHRDQSTLCRSVSFVVAGLSGPPVSPSAP
jgi:hypothetical protein